MCGCQQFACAESKSDCVLDFSGSCTVLSCVQRSIRFLSYYCILVVILSHYFEKTLIFGI